MRACDGVAQRALQMRPPLADSAPADAGKERAIDRTAERRCAARLVLVHVVEGQAGVEARPPPQTHTFAQTPDRPHAPAERGVGASTGSPQTIVLALRIPGLVGVDQRWPCVRRREPPRDELTHARNRQLTAALVEDGVEEARVDLHLPDGRRHALEELPLRIQANHPVAAGAQDQHWRVNRGRIGDDAPRGVVQVEQHVHGDLSEDERILRISASLGGIVRQEARFDVALDVAITEQRFSEPQHGHRRRNVQLHSKGGCGEHQPGDRRREIVDPGGGDDRTDAVADQDDLLGADPVRVADVPYERVGVLDECGDALRAASLSRGPAMSSRIPRKHRDIVQRQRLDDVLPASAVLVAAMKQHDRPPSLR